eukprot:3498826-Rhodomonas_salina.4
MTPRSAGQMSPNTAAGNDNIPIPHPVTASDGTSRCVAVRFLSSTVLVDDLVTGMIPSRVALLQPTRLALGGKHHWRVICGGES